MKGRRPLAAALLTILSLPVDARADTVVLKNGDRVTGRVERVADGRLRIAVDWGATVEIPLADIASLQVDEAVPLRLADGAALSGRVAPGASPGVARVVPAEAGRAPWEIPLVSLAALRDLPPASRITARAGFGGTLADGNRNARSANAELEFNRETDRDAITLRGRWNYQDAEGDVIQRNTSGGLRYDLKFSERTYALGAVEMEQDEFRDIALRTELTAGVGYILWRTDRGRFAVEGGPTYTNTDFDAADDESAVEARLAETFRYDFSKTGQVYQEGEAFPETRRPSRFRTRTEVGVRLKVNGRWSLRHYVRFQYDAAPSKTVLPETGRSVGRRDTVYGLLLSYDL